MYPGALRRDRMLLKYFLGLWVLRLYVMSQHWCPGQGRTFIRLTKTPQSHVARPNHFQTKAQPQGKDNGQGQSEQAKGNRQNAVLQVERQADIPSGWWEVISFGTAHEPKLKAFGVWATIPLVLTKKESQIQRQSCEFQKADKDH